ncbi:MAG: hypothetical protein ACYDHY_06430 [Acidiferrobacterales bacterium]
MVTHEEKIRASLIAWDVVRASAPPANLEVINDLLVALKAESKEFQTQVLEFVEFIRDSAAEVVELDVKEKTA